MIKRYDVYVVQCIPPVRIEAEKVITYSIDDQPVGITFLIKGERVAEFYAEHIAGWKELKEDE